MKRSSLVQQAASFAQVAHEGQTRRGGAPYYTHVHRVGTHVGELTQDEILTAAAYLHDTMEDCEVSSDELDNRFGARVAELVQELTNNEELKEQLGKEEYMVRKLSAMSAEALIIKLCDTLDNMTETDSRSQARVYAQIQRRLQNNPPAAWLPIHQELSGRILTIFAEKFGG